MATFIGVLLILWGMLVLYSSLFRMRQEDFKDKGVIGVSGLIELEFFFRLLGRFPTGVIKGLTILMGISFIAIGIVIV